MKIALALGCLLVLACATIQAGMVYGVIHAQGKPVGKDVKVEAIFGGKIVSSALTDKNGLYQMIVSKEGKVTLTVTYADQKPGIDVYIYDRPVRYNLTLVQEKGKYVIRRD